MEITFLELCKPGPFIFFKISIVSESLEKPYTFIGIVKELDSGRQ